MEIRWTKKAVQNLDAVELFIAQDNPIAALKVIKKIIQAIQLLKHHPSLGRPGRIPNTREFVVAGTPYIVPYRVKEQKIEILRVFHAAMQWPDNLN